MKASHLILLGALGVAAWLVLKPKAAGAVTRIGNTFDGVTEILNNSVPGEAAWGWKYYNNGVAIGPDGTYYKNGEKVWSPA